MALDTIKKVLSAESNADKVVADAYKEREEILRNAEADANRNIQQSISRAKSDAQQLKQQNKCELEKFSAATEKDCGEKIKEIKALAEQNMSKAVDAVINSFFES